MPPPLPTTALRNAQQAGSNAKNTNPVRGLDTLTITVEGDGSGQIKALHVGQTAVNGLADLDRQLQTAFAEKGTGFEQVLIQVGSSVYYQELMQVIDVCTRQHLANGQKLSKLSFVQLPEK
jgi:biopolymer transport protein ExbD